MKKIKRKIGTIILIYLLIAVPLITTNAEVEDADEIQKEGHVEEKGERNYLIIAFGACAGVWVNGYLGEYEGKITGNIHLCLQASLDHPFKLTCVLALNLKTGKIKTGLTLPTDIHIDDFTGQGYIYSYQRGMRPEDATFRFYGFASDCY